MRIKLFRVLSTLFALALLGMSSFATAAVTIKSVLVNVGGQNFCDLTVACGNQIWNLGAGITLNPGDTLILTQTGTMSVGGTVVGGNFDTSDRGPLLQPCTSANPCTTTVSVDFGSGLTQIYSNNAGDPLNAFNTEPTATPSPVFNEAMTWQAAVTTSTYTLQLGYADNEHSAACPASGCFPQPTFGPGGATYFIGTGLPVDFVPSSCGHDAAHPVAVNQTNACYDAGALLFTALQPPPPTGNQGCTPGYWKNHTGSWAGTGFTTGQTVGSVFTGVLASLSGETLLQALQGGGGPGLQGAETILLRAATAALLNAGKGFYPLTKAQIITAVNLALASGNRDTILALASTLDADNNLGCPLN